MTSPQAKEPVPLLTAAKADTLSIWIRDGYKVATLDEISELFRALRAIAEGRAATYNVDTHRCIPRTVTKGLAVEAGTAPGELQGRARVVAAEPGKDAKDAARYRWLRAQKGGGHNALCVARWIAPYTTWEFFSPDGLDAAIDAAMQPLGVDGAPAEPKA